MECLYMYLPYMGTEYSQLVQVPESNKDIFQLNDLLVIHYDQ